MSIYAIPHTNNWIESDIFTKQLLDSGYIEMVGLPPMLSLSKKLEGKMYVADDLGGWVLVDDPKFEDKLNTFIKKVFKTNTVTPTMYMKLSDKLLQLAKNK